MVPSRRRGGATVPRAPGNRLLRLVALLIAASTVLPLIAGVGAAAAPVSVGKVVAPGAFGIPYGQGPNPPLLPFLAPPTDNFADGSLVYDVQVSVEVVNANPYALTVPVVVEEYTPGTAPGVVNVTEPNGTIVPTPEQVPARLDPTWSNASLDVLADSSVTVSLPLAQTSTTRSLSVTVGFAVWSLSVLTPASSSLAGTYSAGGVNAVAADGELAGFVAAIVVVFGAVALTRRVFRTPRAPIWWVPVWALAFGIPFYAFYVPTNQVLGVVTPYLFPFVLGAVSFPFVCRLFRRSSLSLALGIHALNAREEAAAGGVLELIDERLPLRVAPRSWREVLYVAFGAPLRRAIGFSRTVLGELVEVAPNGLPMKLAPGLEAYHAPEEKRVYWYDARYQIEDIPTRLKLRRVVPLDVPPAPVPEGSAPPKVRKAWDPHIEVGSLKAVWIPTQPVMEHLAGLRSTESDATEGEIARLRLLSSLGSVSHRESEAEYRGARAFLESLAELFGPRSEEEIRAMVEKSRGVKHEPEKPKPV